MKKIITTTRKKSLLTGGNTLEHLYTLKDFPVFIGCTSEPEISDLRADMVFDICKKSGWIQLRKLLPLDLVYSQYHSEAVGGVWKAHHEALAKFISEFKLKKILEIGGSNGVLAMNYLSLQPNANWTIIEPNPAIQSTQQIKMIKDYFDQNFKLREEIDGVVHSHVLEHLYDPFVMLDKIYDTIKRGDKHIFSIPNLYVWLTKKFPNTLNFEHTFFLTEEFVDQLLPHYGFKIIAKTKFQEHSIFYATEKVTKKQPLKIKNKYSEYKKMYLEFVEDHLSAVKRINSLTEKFDGNVYLFGAHIFSQALLEFGLKTKKITGILDDSVLKHGKRLYGSPLTVFSPDIIKKQKKVLVIVRAGSYTEEISKRLISMNSEVTLVN